MVKIAVLSDTHGYFDSKIMEQKSYGIKKIFLIGNNYINQKIIDIYTTLFNFYYD